MQKHISLQEAFLNIFLSLYPFTWQDGRIPIQRLINRPGLAGFIEETGQSFFKEKNYLTALLWYIAGEKVFPKNPAFMYHQGLTLDRMGKTGDAIAAFKSTLQLDPHYWKAVCHIALKLPLLTPESRAAQWTFLKNTLPTSDEALNKALQDRNPNALMTLAMKYAKEEKKIPPQEVTSSTVVAKP